MLLDQIKYSDAAEDIIKSFRAYFEEEADVFDAVHKRAEKNVRYWSGDQIDSDRLLTYENAVVDNRILVSIESLVPIAKSRTPEPAVYVAPKTDDSYKLSGQLKDGLTNMWRDDWDMPTKLTQVVRDDYLKYWGILKFCYDSSVDKFNFEVRDPMKIWARSSAKNLQDSDFIIEECELELYKLIALYPDDETDLRAKYGEKTGTKVKYYECCTSDFSICCSLDWDTPFGKQLNPHWNWTAEEIAEVRGGHTEGSDEKDEGDEKDQKVLKRDMEMASDFPYNFFKERRKPYIDFAGFRTGSTIFDGTSLVAQAIPLQDQLNRILIQIDAVAQDNGLDVYDTNQVDEADAQKMVNRGPKAKLGVDGPPNQVMMRLTPNRNLYDLQKQAADIRDSIDNLFGTHATTRGEREGQETLGRSQLLVSGDMNRGLPAIEELAKISQTIYDFALQGIMVYFTQPVPMPISSGDDFTISREDLTYLVADVVAEDGEAIPQPMDEDASPEDGYNDATDTASEDDETVDGRRAYDISITVGQEAVLPLDKTSQAKTAVELANANKLDLKTLYQTLGFADPDQAAYRTILYTSDPKRYIDEVLKLDPNQAPHATDQRDPEVIAALQAIAADQSPQPPTQPNPNGLQLLNMFVDAPEYGQLSTQQKQAFADYLQAYSSALQQS